MKNILQILLIIFLLNSCADGTKKQAIKDVSKIDYPLDSLLSFDSEKALKEMFLQVIPGMSVIFSKAIFFT